jgi:hypothetical protein
MTAVLVVVLISGLFAFRHFLQVQWQKGFKEGFAQGLQQRIVKVQKTTSER